MRKIWSKVVSAILLCITLFCLAGCSGCKIGAENRKKLAAIPKEGSYAFLQYSGVLTKGDEHTVIKSEVLKAIKKDGKKIYNEDDCGFAYVLSEEKDFMWFMAEYSHKSDRNDYQHGQYKFAIGRVTLPNLDIKIEYYLPTQTYEGFGLIGKIGEYFLCRGEEDLLAIHLTTFENKTIDVREKEYHSLHEKELVLRRDLGEKKEYRIYDQTLTEYTISFDKGFNANWYWYANVVGDYIFFYSSADKKRTCLCANYKTGERFAQEESYAMYESYFPPEEETEQEPHFIYKGKGYVCENERYYVERPAKDEDGNDIIQKIYYNKLVFEDLETGEKREFIPLEMQGGCASVMQQIFDIFGNNLHCSPFVQEGELFLVMVNDESFFGIATSQTSPRIVFKYDEEKADLIYVGYAMYTYSAIEHIYTIEK